MPLGFLVPWVTALKKAYLLAIINSTDSSLLREWEASADLMIHLLFQQIDRLFAFVCMLLHCWSLVGTDMDNEWN